ncbi:TonB-dependent receptor [Sphingomonas parva]|uniref:TonB-dependent receptor n=2 Tax=Sphingomonas parva TaxID=2555898 RepID=A0A4Y8ZT99_9SPHN|nr:TonB-dependent receptor [Sphingomonas parva]
MAGAALVALALGGATPALAQDQRRPDGTVDPAGQADDVDLASADPQDQGEILVTGFRRSLENAVVEKKERDQIVESISAEDIGKLPDVSIAESIARLPGLTSQRVSGRSNAISIRGFAPDFSTTLLNGREQTSTGDNRAVEYDQYPSEIMSQVLVYKTPMASLVGQGLSGTVDLRTIRPLAFGRRAISVGGRGTYADLGKLNVDSNKYGWRVNGTYVDQFANDTIGVVLSASYLDEPYQIQEFNAWGYAGTTPAGPPVVIGGSKSYVTSTQLKRLGLQGTLEWQPAPQFTTSIDGFYSDFKDDQIKRGVELPLAFGGAPLSGATASDGFVTSGTYSNVEGVVRNDAFQRHAKLYSFGWNGKYEGDDGWNATFDVSMSKTDRNELVLESNAGTGRGAGVGATDTIGFMSDANGTRFSHQLNYGDYNTILLTSPLGWGGDQTAVDGRRIRGGQDGYYNNRIIEDELWQYRMEVEKELDGFLGGIRAGLNYTDRTKALTPDEAFLGLVANTDGLTSVAVPSQYQLGTTDLTYLGLGPVISYDPVALLEAGIYQLVPNPYGDVVVKSYDISEKLMTAYWQADIDAELGSSLLTGNFGVQAIWTGQNSNGATATFLGTNPNGSPNIGATQRRSSVDYVDVLPSLNLSLRFPSDFVIRAGAAREIIRPRLDDMRASLSFDYTIVDPDGPAGPQPAVAFATGRSGNPELRPWRANAFDLTFEKYFGNQGYVALQLFYKDLKTYIYNQDVEIPTSELTLANPGSGIVLAPSVEVNVPINGTGGSLYGAELAATLPFSVFANALDGFGVTGGLSYTKTQIEPTPGEDPEDIPGYSKWVANGTAFFEKWGFSARASVRYRSSFVGEVSGFGAARTRRRAASETIVDAQIGYDFQPGSSLEGLSLFLQGQNLTDEPFVTFDPGERLRVIDFQRYGRRFLAGFTFKF